MKSIWGKALPLAVLVAMLASAAAQARVTKIVIDETVPFV